MSTTQRPAPSAPSSTHRGRTVAAVLSVTALLLSGCGLRMESDGPAEPVPDAAETVRRGAVDDALAVADAARAAGGAATGDVATVLALVDATARAQVDPLGGVYVSGVTPSPTPSPSATPAAPVTAQDVLALLGRTASDARTDAVAEPDPGMARLLAAVAAGRAQLAARLAGALGAEVPALDAPPQDALPLGGAADGSGSGDGSAARETPSASPSAAPTPAPTATTATADTATVLRLAAAEDQAGYGYEVAAARLSGDARTAARDAARDHRARADAWARQAGVADTAQDPRRVTYALPADLSGDDAVRAFCAGLEAALASAHADAVLGTAAGSTDRAQAVDGLRRAALAAPAWGAEPVALPGLPAASGAVADAPAAMEQPTAAG